MGATEPDRQIEIVGADSGLRAGPGGAGWIVPALVVLAAGALWMATSGGSDAPVALPPVPGPVEEPAPEGAPPDWEGHELLVAVDGTELVAIDPVDGTWWSFPLRSPPHALAAGVAASVFVLNADRTVDLVDLETGRSDLFASDVEWFAPSATRGRVWLRVGSSPGRIFETDVTGRELSVIDRVDDPDGDPRLASDEQGRLTLLTGGDRVALGRYAPVAATGTTLFGQRCDAGRCRVERRALSPTADWTPITARPKEVDRVVASADGQWLLSLGRIVVLYRTDRWGPILVHTGATEAVFGGDSTALYVFTGRSEVTVVDLLADANRSVDVGTALSRGLGWVTVAR